jgi:hypothetical protein
MMPQVPLEALEVYRELQDKGGLCQTTMLCTMMESLPKLKLYGLAETSQLTGESDSHTP